MNSILTKLAIIIMAVLAPVVYVGLIVHHIEHRSAKAIIENNKEAVTAKLPNKDDATLKNITSSARQPINPNESNESNESTTPGKLNSSGSGSKGQSGGNQVSGSKGATSTPAPTPIDTNPTAHTTNPVTNNISSMSGGLGVAGFGQPVASLPTSIPNWILRNSAIASPVSDTVGY
jgi:hypothetical protein